MSDITKPIVQAVLADKDFQKGIDSFVEDAIFESRKIQEAIEEGVRRSGSNTGDEARLRGEVDRLQDALTRAEARLERLEGAFRTLGDVARDLR